MRKILNIFALAILLTSTLMAASGPNGTENKISGTKATVIDNTHFIDANKVLMFINNNGGFGRDLSDVFGYDYGTWFPYSSDTSDVSNNSKNAGLHSPLFAGGLWIGAIDSASGDTRVVVSEYSSEYIPGYMEYETYAPDRPAFRIYKLYRDSLANNPNDDYIEWPVDQGAPIDEFGDPIMLGDQMLWSVFNDADPAQHNNNNGYSTPLGLEIRHTTWGFDRVSYLGNIIFMRWRIYNKGGNTLKNCYFSIWADPDVGFAGNDLVGCDTLRSLGFAYNADNDDSQYSDMPLPAMGLDLLQSPVVYTGNPDDQGYMWGKIWPGYINPGMTSFNKYINGTDPDSAAESFYYMRGLTKNGDPYVYDGETLTYFCSGDPVASTGDLDTNPNDQRFMVNSGPYEFRPGDSTEIIAALAFGQGLDNISSIAVMKENDYYAKFVYYDGFDDPTDADDQNMPLPTGFALFQNYPNPFNPSTNIEFTLPKTGAVKIDVFNLLGQKIATIMDESLSAGKHTVSWDGRNESGQIVSSGIYFYRLQAGGIVETRKMVLMK